MRVILRVWLELHKLPALNYLC